MSLVAIGVAAGAVLGVGLMRLVRSLLFGVEPTDPLVLAGAAGILATAAALATYLPARRAARVNPVSALKCE
jgi:ABC-type antimicrobial peptide transport system permease subunit